MLTIGAGASIEPEVDLSGYWIDGDVVHVGPVHIGREAVVGARSTIGPDVHIGREVVVEAGSTVLRSVRPGRVVAGSPAQRVAAPGRPGLARHAAPRGSGAGWRSTGSPVSSCRSCPSSRCSPGCCCSVGRRRERQAHDVVGAAYAAVPLVTVLALVTLAAVTIVLVRLLGLGLREGYHPVRSRVGWQVWATERLLDQARTLLFPHLREPHHARRGCARWGPRSGATSRPRRCSCCRR